MGELAPLVIGLQGLDDLQGLSLPGLSLQGLNGLRRPDDVQGVDGPGHARAQHTDRDLARYSRTSRLAGIGIDGQARIAAARVLIVGAGGLGCPVIQYISMSGLGSLGIVDDDTVDISNLQRQVLFRPDQVGLPKARAAAEWVRAANPDVTVTVHPFRLTEATVSIFDDYDLIIDGSDSFDTCYLVADAAAARGLPVVWGSVQRFDGQVSVFWDAAPDGRGVDYRDLHPEPPVGYDESCADVGVLGPLCGTVGSVMASEAIKLVTGAGDPLLGRVVTLDAAGGTWRESRVVRSPARGSQRARGAPDPASLTSPVEHRDVQTVTAEQLEARLQERSRGGYEFTLLDVRERAEHDAGAIEGSVLAAGFGSTSAVHPEISPDRPVVVYCARGPRATAAARMLAAEGFDVSVLQRGMLGWTLRPSAFEVGAPAAPASAPGRVALPLGDIDPAAFHPNPHS